jgi:hypothetical protein
MRALALALLLAAEAAAQTAPDRTEVRELRRDGLITAQEAAEADRPVDYKMLAGVAYTEAENGERRWATPYQLRIRFNRGKTYLKFSGDGLVSSRTDEGEASGLANINIGIGHRLAKGLRGTFGVMMPTAGEVGSQHGRARAGLSYEYEFTKQWHAAIEAQVARYADDPDPGESRIRRQGLVQGSYVFHGDTLALVQFERIYRPGVSSASVVTVGYQRPIGQTARGRPVLGIATLSHGLTAGREDTTLELDVSWRF